MAKKIEIKNPRDKSETADGWVDVRDKKKRLTIDVSSTLHTQLKISAAKMGETMAEMICSILEEKLKEP